MKRNGFTLIELLAVIVILAIIALIATPIILGIINDAREKANERSVELYASAVKNAIAAYQLEEGKEVKPDTYKKETLPFIVEYDGNVECESIIISKDSKVSLKECTVNGGEKTYNYGIEEETPSLAGTIGICRPLSDVTEGVYKAGDKYECDVDPQKQGYDYIFFVLNSTSTEVNLIMDSNITRTGEAIKEENPSDKGLVLWITKDDYTSEEIGGTEAEWDEVCDECGNTNKGPISAMNYLQTATNGWSNVNLQTINSFQECENGSNCVNKPMAKTYTVNARLPYLTEVSDVKPWLSNYMEDYGNTTNKVSGVEGYLLASVSSGVVHCLDAFATTNTWYVIYTDAFGVRPVINLSI